MLIIIERDNGREVDITCGESLQIILSENATTGYRWTIDHYNKEIFELVTSEGDYLSNPIGSGGEIKLIFKTKKKGRGEILLKNWRHWEGESSVISRFGIVVHVKT